MVSLYFEATEEQKEELEKIELHDYKEVLARLYDEVYCYEEFGSYQGDWLAKVRKGNEVFWLLGWYGSCSGCDFFLSIENYPWEMRSKTFEEAKKQYQEETDRILKAFRDDYEADKFTQEEIEKHYEERLKSEWSDDEDAAMLEYVKSHANIENKGVSNGKAN